MNDSRADVFWQSGVNVVLRPLAVAGFFVLVAFLWTLVLQHIFPYPFLFLFLGAVMGSGWFGGRAAGILAVIVSTVIVDYFFVPPFYSFNISPIAQVYSAAFIGCALIVSWLSASRRRVESTIREAKDHLEQRVLERTEALRKSVAAIEQSERRLRTLTEAIPQQIWSADQDGRVDYCNQHLLDFLGRDSGEVTGEEFFGIFHPADRSNVRKGWRDSIQNGQPFEGEWRVGGTDGYRWFLVRCLPQRSAAGEVERWYGTNIDVEERRRAELALAEAHGELSKISHRLSMGEMAASIAHELNQPLTALAMNADACREWLQATPPNYDRASATAEKIVRETKRASEVVRRVRSLFRKEIDSRTPVDMNHLIQELVRLIQDEAIRRGISIFLELQPALPRVTADWVQIQQVLLNLAVNGMDAIGPHQKDRELRFRTCLGLHSVDVQVIDTGAGIPPFVVDRMFDPFFTTKPQGIGMGLAISRSIIEAHDGKLLATGRPEGGSSFRFTIPVR